MTRTSCQTYATRAKCKCTSCHSCKSLAQVSHFQDIEYQLIKRLYATRATRANG